MNTKRWLERQTRRRDDIARDMANLDDKALAELARCATTDQLPGPSASSGGGGRSSVGTHSDPTLNAALGQVCAAKGCDLLDADHANADHEFEPWIVRADEWVRAFEFEMAKAAYHSARADRLRGLVCNRARELDRTYPKPGAGDCQACGRWVPGMAEDRIRSGYCDACRKAWERAGFPDRSKFKEQRRPRPQAESAA